MTEVYTDEGLSLSLDNTWIEEDEDYPRLVTVSFWAPEILQSNTNALMSTMGSQLRTRVARKLESELGLVHKKDYIFTDYSEPRMQEGRWLTKPPPAPDFFQFAIRMRQEEHFTMFKLHYGN